MEAPTDEQLIREFLGGDQASFELIVRRHTPELYQFAQRLTGGSMAAEDVVQETFLKVYTSSDGFDPQRRFKPWLFTIAANKARDQLRRRGRRREVSFEAQVDHEQDSKQRYIHLLSGEASPPDDDLVVDERRRLVREIVEQMPQRLSEVLVLAYYHRFPYRDVAEILGIPLGTVKSRLHAAIGWFSEQYNRSLAEREEKQH